MRILIATFKGGENIMLLQETVMLKWNPKNIKHYKEKGYNYTKLHEFFEVDIRDLTEYSKIKISYSCDYCRIEKKKAWADYIKENNNFSTKDCCKSCYPLKLKETFSNRVEENPDFYKEIQEKIKQTHLEKRGVEHHFMLEEIKNQIKETNIEKHGSEYYSSTDEFKEKFKETMLANYGVEHPSKSIELQEKKVKTVLDKYGVSNVAMVQEFHEKQKETMMERYGVEYSLQSENIRFKWRETNIEIYGTEHPAQSDIVKDKTKTTNIERYGVEYTTQSPEVREKMASAYYKNGTIKTSSQQLKIYEILKDNGYDVELNYPVSSMNLDIAIFIKDMRIDLEYDGTYWHKDKQKDRKRDEFLKKEGWKILRIIGKRDIPSLEELKISIDKLINSDRTFTKIELKDAKSEAV